MAIFNSYVWHRRVYFVISIILMMIASIAEPVHWKAKKRNSAEAVTLLHYLDVSQFQSFRTNLSILDDQIQFFSVDTPNLFTKNSRFVIGRFQVANICPASIRADNLSLFAACNGSRRPDRATGSIFGNRMDIDINLLWNLSCKDQKKNNSRVHIKQTHTPQIRLWCDGSYSFWGSGWRIPSLLKFSNWLKQHFLEMFGMLKIKNHQAHISKNNG